MNKKILFLILVFLLRFQDGFSQIESDSSRAKHPGKIVYNPHYINASLTFSAMAARNELLSPISFYQPAYGLNLSFWYFQEWGFLDANINSYYSRLMNMAGLIADYGQSGYGNIGTTLNTYWNFLLFKNQANKFFIYGGAGPELDIKAEYLSNSATSYNNLSLNMFLTVNPSIVLKYRLAIGKEKFDVGQHIRFPLFGVGILPLYSSMAYIPLSDGPDEELQGESGAVFVTPFNLHKIDLQTTFDWRITRTSGEESNCILRLAYAFKGSAIQFDQNNYQSAYQTFMVGLIVKF